MYGDGAHKKLLDGGWRWDSVEYARDMKQEITVYLYPWGGGDLREMRSGRWSMSIAPNGGERETIASYPNLNTAAMAAVGVE